MKRKQFITTAPYPQLAEIEVAGSNTLHQTVYADFTWCRQKVGQRHLVVHMVSTQHLQSIQYFSSLLPT